MIPGSDILDDALQLIDTQAVSYYKYTSRTTDAVGRLITSYANPVVIDGSFQPVPRALYWQYGLDFSKDYVNFYVSKNLVGVSRDISGDKLVFNNKTYQCESATEWFGIDGWVAILAVQLNA